MKLTRILFLALGLLASLSLNTVAFGHEGHKSAAAADYSGKGELTPVTKSTDAAWLAKARADYPLTTCAVSGDKLEDGDMGPPQEFIYKEAGKPDLFVRLCCKDCIKGFHKDPAKYLKMIGDAAAKKTAK
jgi:hypothetical protein